MSTHANIIIDRGASAAQGTRYESIYLHNDGYVKHVSPILHTHYTTIESVEALIALGELSQLAESTECPEGHSFDNVVKGHCVAYGRDRGEYEQKFISDDITDHTAETYIYIFIAESNTWVINTPIGVSH